MLLMRSIPVMGEASIALCRSYEGIADFLLLDSHRESDRQIGALGVTHDCAISRRIVQLVCTPVILAGGLGRIMLSMRSERFDRPVWTRKRRPIRTARTRRTSDRCGASMKRHAVQGERCRPAVMRCAAELRSALSIRPDCRSRDIQSSGDLARLLPEVAGVRPELFESAEDQGDAFEISVSDRRLAQHPDVRTMHIVEAIP